MGSRLNGHRITCYDDRHNVLNTQDTDDEYLTIVIEKYEGIIRKHIDIQRPSTEEILKKLGFLPIANFYKKG